MDITSPYPTRKHEVSTFHRLEMGGRSSAFTLVELMVVISVISLMIALLLPALSKSRAIAVMTSCKSGMRQQAMYIGLYQSDCKGFLPSASTAHRMQLAPTPGFGTGSRLIYAKAHLYAMTASPYVASDPGCDYGSPAAQPLGYGWFYFQGYIDPIKTGTRNPLGILQCPGAPLAVRFNGFQTNDNFYTASEKSFSTYSNISRVLASHNLSQNVNPGGASVPYHCYPYSGVAGYINRGWARKNITTCIPRADDWRPNDAWVVDNEFWIQPGLWTGDDSGWGRNHEGVVNIMFIDGHVKDRYDEMSDASTGMDSLPASVYYSVKLHAETEQNAFQNSNSGFSSNGSSDPTTGTIRLWTFYETGQQ